MSRYIPRYVVPTPAILSYEQFDMGELMSSMESFVAMTKLQATLAELERPLDRAEKLVAGSFSKQLTKMQRTPVAVSLETIYLADLVDGDISLEGMSEKVKGFLKTIIQKIISFFKWMIGKFKELFNRNAKARKDIEKAKGHGAEVGKKAYIEYKKVSTTLQNDPNPEVRTVAKEATALAEQGKVKEAKAKIQEAQAKFRNDSKHTEKRAEKGKDVDQYIKDQGGEHGNTDTVAGLNKLSNLLSAVPDNKTQSMMLTLSSKSYANFISNVIDIIPVCNAGKALAGHCKIIPTLTKDMVQGLDMKYDRDLDRDQKKDIQVVQAKVSKEYLVQISTLEKNDLVKQFFNIRIEKGQIPKLHMSPNPDREAQKVHVSIAELDKYLPAIGDALEHLGNGLKVASTASAFSNDLNEFLNSSSSQSDQNIQLQAQFLQAFMMYCGTLAQSTMRINQALSGFALESTAFINAHLN